MEKKTILKGLPFWEKMTKQQQELFLHRGKIGTYKDRQLIYSPARECLGMISVISGIVVVYFTAEDGRKATVFRLRSGDTCALSMSCLFSAITFDVEIEAEGECEILIVPAVTFAEVSKENVYVENFSYKIITEHFSDVMEAVYQLLFMSLEQRIVSFLLNEAAASHSDQIVITQERLAESIGSAREAVSRGLKKLSAAGFLEIKRGVIVLKDKSGLYQMMP